jgi:hypothetical protein
MDDLIKLFQGSLIRRESVSDILGVNSTTAQTGLIFSPSQAAVILQARDRALSDNGRLELGSGMVKKLILAFYDSPFFQNVQAVDTLESLLEIFYYMKNETFDTIGDDELIAFLRERFDGECRGSLELLRDDAIRHLARVIHGAVREDGEAEDDGEEETDE